MSWHPTIVSVTADPKSANVLLLATYASDEGDTFAPPPAFFLNRPEDPLTDAKIASYMNDVCVALANRDAGLAAVTVKSGAPVPFTPPVIDPDAVKKQAQAIAKRTVLQAANEVITLKQAGVAADDPTMVLAQSELAAAQTASAVAIADAKAVSGDLAAAIV